MDKQPSEPSEKEIEDLEITDEEAAEQVKGGTITVRKAGEKPPVEY